MRLVREGLVAALPTPSSGRPWMEQYLQKQLASCIAVALQCERQNLAATREGELKVRKYSRGKHLQHMDMENSSKCAVQGVALSMISNRQVVSVIRAPFEQELWRPCPPTLPVFKPVHRLCVYLQVWRFLEFEVNGCKPLRFDDLGEQMECDTNETLFH